MNHWEYAPNAMRQRSVNIALNNVLEKYICCLTIFFSSAPIELVGFSIDEIEGYDKRRKGVFDSTWKSQTINIEKHILIYI